MSILIDRGRKEADAEWGLHVLAKSAHTVWCAEKHLHNRIIMGFDQTYKMLKTLAICTRFQLLSSGGSASPSTLNAPRGLAYMHVY